MKTLKKYDVVIVGGGLVGASLAAALKDSGLTLALLEARIHATSPDMSTQNHHPNPLPIGADTNESLRDTPVGDDWDNRIYAISPGSRHFLEKINAWSKLDKRRIEAITQMRIFGDTDSMLEFSAYQMGVDELACILENRALQHALWQTLQDQENLTSLHPAYCAALTVNDTDTTITLQDGRRFNANLIVGADGRNSWVRKQAGLNATPIDYQQQGVVANFNCKIPHRGIAHQWFHPTGILALLPLPGNRTSMVWSVSPKKSAELLTQSPEALCKQVCAASQHTLGELQLITAAAAFPLRLLTLPNISAKRIALIGDAAHNIHPLAGQGVNTGFRDARQLARILNDRGGCSDCGDAQLLRRYERMRKEDIYSMQATTYGLKNLFCNDDPILRSLRNIGLNTANHLSPLKKQLMQHAFN
ncbi:MAG: UbiH/UbiF family hydroxylase [Gallionella sp.]